MESNCLICGSQLDDNHFYPATFPGIDQKICCNCDENLGLMFTNFEEKPGDHGYMVPDYSDLANILIDYVRHSGPVNKLTAYSCSISTRLISLVWFQIGSRTYQILQMNTFA